MRPLTARWPVWAALLPLLPMAAGRQGPFYLAPSLILIMRLVWLTQEKLLARHLPPAGTSWVGLFSLSMAGMVFLDEIGLQPYWILSVIMLGHTQGPSRFQNAAQLWVTGALFLTPFWIFTECFPGAAGIFYPLGAGILFGAAVGFHESVIFKLFTNRREPA